MAKPDERETAAWADNQLAILNPGESWQPDVIAGLLRLERHRRRLRGADKRWAWIAAGATGLCFVLLAVPTSRVLAHRCLECTVEAWQALARPAASKAKLTPENLRKFAPDFVLKDAAGRDIQLSDLRGKVVLVNFWATWCHGCQIEIPWLVQFEKKYEGHGLAIVGVSMDEDGWKSVRPWIAQKHVNYTIVIGNQLIGKEYGVWGMPLSVLVDKQGKIADTHQGIVDRVAEQSEIETLLGQPLSSSFH